MLGADDALDVFGVHGVGGILGALLTGVFCAPALGGTGCLRLRGQRRGRRHSSIGPVHHPGLAVGITLVWSAVVAFIAYKIVDMIVGLRVPERSEREGLDINEHGESGVHVISR